MIRIGRKRLIQLAAVYYISLFLFLNHYYSVFQDVGTVAIEKRTSAVVKNLDSKDMATKVDELSKLSDVLTRKLTELHLNLSQNVEKILNDTKEQTSHVKYESTKISNRVNVNVLPQNITELTKGKIKPEDMVVHVSSNGDVQVNKTALCNHLKNSLRKWDYENEIIAFMHIGKNGGTSFRSGLMKAPQDSGCKLKGTNNVMKQETHKCPGSVPCVCNKHYDWTVIDDLESRKVKVASLALLRNPVKRSVSHFYFAQTLPWTKGTVMREQSITQYLQDPESMLNTRDVWQDGQVISLKIILHN